MALTLEAEQRLERVSLAAFYKKHQAMWHKAAKKTYGFIKVNFPPGSLIRRDDVAKALIPILEVNETLREKINIARLRQKFWIRDFGDLIIDQTWDDLQEDGKGDGDGN